MPIQQLILNFSLLILAIDSKVNDDNKTIKNIENGNSFKKKPSQIYAYNAICEKTQWYCSDSCRWRNANEGACSRTTEKHCFGNKINYTFMDYDDDFPNHLKLVEHFPSCWEALNPLICAVHFQPCEYKKFVEGPDSTVTREIWQLFPYKFCSDAQQKCGFLIKAGLWPKTISCSDMKSSLKMNEAAGTVAMHRRILFDESDQCKFPYNQLEPLASPGCISPLVEVHNSDKLMLSQPVIDRCYTPCDSAFVSSPTRLQLFRLMLFWYTLILGSCFLVATAYTSFGLKERTNKFLIFALKMMFLSATSFYILWAYFLRKTSTRAACVQTSSNELVRKRTITEEFDWCTIQRLLLNTLMIAGFTWLTVFSYTLCVQKFLTSEESGLNLSSNTMSLQVLVMTTVFGLSTLVSLISLLMRTELNDGIVNVCYDLLDPFLSNLFFYMTLLFLILIAFIFWGRMFAKYRNTWRFHRSLVTSGWHARHRQPLVNNTTDQSSNIEYGRSCKSYIKTELTERKSQAFTVYWCFLIVFSFFVSTIAMAGLHFFFKFNTTNEKLAIDNRIKIDSCEIETMSLIDLAHLFTYAFLLPSLPFVYILGALAYGLYTARWNLWRICDSASEMQLLHLTSKLPQDDDEEVLKPHASVKDSDTTMPSFVSRAVSEPGVYKPKPKKQGRRKRFTRRVPGKNSRLLNCADRLKRCRLNYVPPYVIMPTKNKKKVNVNVSKSFPALPQLDQEQVYLLCQIAQLNLFNQTQMQQVHMTTFGQMQFVQEVNPVNGANPSHMQAAVDDALPSDADTDDSNDFDSDEVHSDELKLEQMQETSASSLCSKSDENSLLEEEKEDNDYPTCSLVVHEITKYAQINDVGNKSEFVQRAFEHFRDLFEQEPMFQLLCKRQREADPCNHNEETLDGSHLITIPEVLNLAIKVRKNAEIYRMGILCKEAIDKAKESIQLNLASNLPS